MNQKTLLILLALIFSSCSSRPFSTEKVCSKSSLKYLKDPRNKSKRAPMSAGLNQEMQNTQMAMQYCYDDFKRRTGRDEFQTCLVVGVDPIGQTEYFDFSSKEVPLDSAFLKCAQAVTRKVPYPKYGSNYILIQSYNFHY
jgi:hypothetical protein